MDAIDNALPSMTFDEIFSENSVVYDNTLFTTENSDELCQLSELEDMDYYIFCDTAINDGPSDILHTYGIYGGITDKKEEGEQLYQKFKEEFFKQPEVEADLEKDAIVYISPDGQWVITQRYLGLDERGILPVREQALYHNGQLHNKLHDTYSYAPFAIVSDENGYRELEELNYEMRKELSSDLWDNGYLSAFVIDESGHYIAVEEYGKLTEPAQQLDILDITGEEIVYSFPLQGIVGRNSSDIIQFYGNGEKGTIILQSYRDFYELSYPSGEIRLLGKDMYALSYSPDGKYIVYSSPNIEVAYSFDKLDWEASKGYKRGIFVREVATGRTAYIECDIEISYLNKREFYWIDKNVVDK